MSITETIKQARHLRPGCRVGWEDAHTIDVAANPFEGGVVFEIEYRSAWARNGQLTSALRRLVERPTVVHPWDGWPGPSEQRGPTGG